MCCYCVANVLPAYLHPAALHISSTKLEATGLVREFRSLKKKTIHRSSTQLEAASLLREARGTRGAPARDLQKNIQAFIQHCAGPLRYFFFLSETFWPNFFVYLFDICVLIGWTLLFCLLLFLFFLCLLLLLFFLVELCCFVCCYFCFFHTMVPTEMVFDNKEK